MYVFLHLVLSFPGDEPYPPPTYTYLRHYKSTMFRANNAHSAPNPSQRITQSNRIFNRVSTYRSPFPILARKFPHGRYSLSEAHSFLNSFAANHLSTQSKPHLIACWRNTSRLLSNRFSVFRTALPRNVGPDDRTNRNVERNETDQETIEAGP